MMRYVDWKDYTAQCLDCEYNRDIRGKSFKAIQSLEHEVKAAQKPVKLNCALSTCPYHIVFVFVESDSADRRILE